MKFQSKQTLKYLVSASLMTLALGTSGAMAAANPCNPCSAKPMAGAKANPCSAKNPCAAKTKANPKAAKKANPCSAKNPCAAKKY